MNRDEIIFFQTLMEILQHIQIGFYVSKQLIFITIRRTRI